MNIQQLEYIIAVDQFKNFSSAAAHCYVTQGTLNAMITKLEVELDTVIFDRRNKSIVTTSAGREVIFEAKKIVEHSERLIQKAKGINDNIEGSIQVGIIPSLEKTLTSFINEPLQSAFPELHLKFSQTTAEEIIKQIKSGELQLGISNTPVLPSELGQIILFKEALMIYGDVNQKNLWVYDDGPFLKSQFIELFEDSVLHFESMNIKPVLFDVLLNQLDEHGGATLISELSYQQLSAERKSHISLFPLPVPIRSISIIYHKKYTNIKIVQALANQIRGTVNKLLKASDFNSSEINILDEIIKG